MSSIPSSPPRRLFIAVMLPDEARARLARMARLLEAHHAILRPVRPEALHVTLRFLGEQTVEHERLAAEACAAAAAGVTAFPLSIGGFGAFPNERRPRVVWLGLRVGADSLIALHRRVQDELIRRRVVLEREELVPHLTLARVRQESDSAARAALGAALGTLPSGEQAHCMADAVSLVHSVLTLQGSAYTTVGYWPLQNPDSEPWSSAP